MMKNTIDTLRILKKLTKNVYQYLAMKTKKI